MATGIDPASAGTGRREDSAQQAEVDIARLQRRLDRERKARRDAEEIAERGMRELWLTNQMLDARVSERTADLENTLDQLRVASSARERFLATLSHEMRTPLNGILGMLELLGPHLHEDRPLTYLDTARESAERLHQLLARLLDLVELETGELEPVYRPVPGRQVGESIRERWARPLLKNGQLLTVDSSLGGHVLEIDQGRIGQIVDELLDNVLAHSSAGAVHVVLRLADDKLTIEVRDTGPGIDSDHIDSLFDDFSMLDDTTARAQQGLGLGLGLCRRIAAALGGNLRLESDGTSYTTATLTVTALSWPDE